MEPLQKRLNRREISLAASAGLLFTAAIWGFAFVVVKDSLDYVGAIYMIAFRFTLAAGTMMAIFFRKLRLLNRQYMTHGIITGIFLFMAYATQTIGCDYTTAGKNAFLTTIYVILIPMISWFLYRKRPGWHIFTAAALALAGIGLLALGADDTGGLNKGDALTLVCGVFYALHIVWTARYNDRGDDPLLMTMLQFTCCAMLGWLLAPLYDGSFPAPALCNLRVISSMLYLGLFSTMVAFSLQNLGLKFVQPAIASLLLSFECVFGVLFSTWLLRESITLRMGTGCILIFTAVILAETKFQFRKK
ncbi:MAG: DMT family transporter [Spirochaetia bacterium]|nr:DMT family transporter [Spirochaetia bacterium]